MSAAAYLDLPVSRAAGEPDWVTQQRLVALDRFRTLKFPGRNNEAWRLTDLKVFDGAVFAPLTDAVAGDAGWARQAVQALRLPGAHLFVLVNGRHAPDLSDPGAPDGVTLVPLARKPAAAEPLLALIADGFAALGAVHFRDGAVLRFDGDTAQPVQVLHLTDAATGRASVHGLMRVEVAAGARGVLLETHSGRGDYWNNQGSLIVVGEKAHFTHAKQVAEDAAAVHIARQAVRIGAEARYDGYVLTEGGRLVRQDTMADLQGDHGFCGYNAVTLRRAGQATVASEITHDARACETREIVKSVADGTGHALFQGRINVTPKGQKTDAYQLSQALLLSEDARTDAKPELEILADDVKCSHGSTVGDLDETQMFYLVSRGLSRAEARALLIGGFCAAAFETLEDAAMRDHLTARLDMWLGRQEAAA